MRCEEERGRPETYYEKVHVLLKDFLNLKVGGLLPDREPKREGDTVYKMQEWTVIVFPCRQGQGKNMILLDSTYNRPPKEGDWMRHPCCGTTGAVRSAPLRNPTDWERFGPAPNELSRLSPQVSFSKLQPVS